MKIIIVGFTLLSLPASAACIQGDMSALQEALREMNYAVVETHSGNGDGSTIVRAEAANGDWVIVSLEPKTAQKPSLVCILREGKGE